MSKEIKFNNEKFIKNKSFYRYRNFCFKIKKLDRKRIVKDGSLEEHHIVPKSFGGLNEKENMVLFKIKEHLFAHYLLTLCTKGIWKNKMILALHRMIHGNKGYKNWINSTLYAENKKKMVKEQIKFSIYKDKDGNIERTTIDDPRIKSGELVGVNKGIKRSEDFKKNVSKHSLGNKHALGHKHSDEARNKIGNSSVGKICAKDKDGNKIRVSVDDDRLKDGTLVFLHTGTKQSIETRKKRSESMIGKTLGRKVSKETREKQSKAKIGKKNSMEHNENIKKSWIKRRENKKNV